MRTNIADPAATYSQVCGYARDIIADNGGDDCKALGSNYIEVPNAAGEYNPYDPPIPQETCIVLPRLIYGYFEYRYTILDSEGVIE